MDATKKFKVGDRVRRHAGRNYVGGKGRAMEIGDEGVVVGLDSYGGWPVVSGFEHIGGNDPGNLELVSATSPIRTVTRREIVPGKYGMVWIGDTDAARQEVNTRFSGTLNATGLREAAHLFNQIAEVLEENAGKKETA